MLGEETDTEFGNLACSTIMILLNASCPTRPSRWLSICKNMILSSPRRRQHLRYATRVFAAECLNHLPEAVGENPAHFDLSLARAERANGEPLGDWLVLQLHELISLAYQISTNQFAKMRPIGVSLLCTIMDKFAAIPDPELPGHLLLTRYEYPLVDTVRNALNSSSCPILLGCRLATKEINQIYDSVLYLGGKSQACIQ